jgi:hypothetical protein
LYIKHENETSKDIFTLKNQMKLKAYSIKIENALHMSVWWHGGIYCILASCYIRLTLNICSFVNNQHGGRKDNTIILTNGQLTISTTSGEAHV